VSYGARVIPRVNVCVVLPAIGTVKASAFPVLATAGVVPVALRTYIVAVARVEVTLDTAIVETIVWVAAGLEYRSRFEPDGVACPRMR
jgi:cation transporter-like permease